MLGNFVKEICNEEEGLGKGNGETCEKEEMPSECVGEICEKKGRARRKCRKDRQSEGLASVLEKSVR